MAGDPLSSELYAIGGEQRVHFAEQPEWTMYERALVVHVAGGEARPLFAWQSPPAHCPDDRPSHTFKSATLDGERAYLCTQTEVLVCRLPAFALERVISLPCFNDLHHVAPGPDGLLYVVVTGLDAVAMVTPEGRLERLVSVVEASPWERFSPAVDYRKVATTKPHRAHPNHVFFLDGRAWVTRFEQRDAVPLDGGGGRLEIGNRGGHDGHLATGGIWFTTVDGHLVRFDLATGERRDLDLNPLNPSPELPLGWCRGLLIEGRHAWVGFSRIRFTRLRQNVSWIRHGFRATGDHRNHPTRTALYDVAAPRLLAEVDLEPAGLGAVFGVYAATPKLASRTADAAAQPSASAAPAAAIG